MCVILVLGIFALNSDAALLSWIFALLMIILVYSLFIFNVLRMYTKHIVYCSIHELIKINFKPYTVHHFTV